MCQKAIQSCVSGCLQAVNKRCTPHCCCSIATNSISIVTLAAIEFAPGHLIPANLPSSYFSCRQFKQPPEEAISRTNSPLSCRLKLALGRSCGRLSGLRNLGHIFFVHQHVSATWITERVLFLGQPTCISFSASLPLEILTTRIMLYHLISRFKKRQWRTFLSITLLQGNQS